MKKYIKKYLKSLMAFKISKKDLKSVIALSVLYILAFSAIFRANFYYFDDLGRSFEGYHGWLDWSRYFTTIAATIVHADLYLSDISPLLQILACIVMAASGILSIKIFYKDRDITIWNIVAASLAGLTPYFLGMISYKYDSLYMALSYLFCLIPFLYLKENNRKKYIIISIICIILMCTSYQASSGIYPMIVVFLVVENIVNDDSFGYKKTTESSGEKFLGINKKTRNLIVDSVISYAVGILFFSIFLMRKNEGASAFPLTSLPKEAVKRYVTYFGTVFSDFKKLWLLLIALLVLLYIAVTVKNAFIKKWKAAIITCAGLLASSILCFGVYLYIDRDAYDPRDMFGFCVLLSLMAIKLSSRRRLIIKFIYAYLAWCFFTFSFSYGNALAAQKDYALMRMELVADALIDEDLLGKEYIAISGDIGIAPVIEGEAEGYDMLNRLMFTMFGEGHWYSYYFLNYMDMPYELVGADTLYESDFDIVTQNDFYTISVSDDTVLLELE